ncbi:MAG: lysophospholipid acyltransferase family protein [Thermomicrobiales bacterium]
MARTGGLPVQPCQDGDVGIGVRRDGNASAESNWYRVMGVMGSIQARFAKGAVRFIAERILAFHIEVHGQENVPRDEPLIVVGAPHRNWPDGFLLLLAMPALPRMWLLASEHAFSKGWRRALLRLIGGVQPVSTTSPLNRDAITAALDILERGDRVGIFAEGWDHLTGPPREVGSLRRGVAFIAEHAECRVLPVALAGSKPLWRGKTLRVAIGAPMAPPPPTAHKIAQQAWNEQLRAVLQDLIPPDPPDLPVSQRRWPWLTDIFN